MQMASPNWLSCWVAGLQGVLSSCLRTGRKGRQAYKSFSFKCRQFLALSLVWGKGIQTYSYLYLESIYIYWLQIYIYICYNLFYFFFLKIYISYNLIMFFLLKIAWAVLNQGPPSGKPPGSWRDKSTSLWRWQSGSWQPRKWITALVVSYPVNRGERSKNNFKNINKIAYYSYLEP